MMDLKGYIDECDRHNHRYFWFCSNNDFDGIRNNHVIIKDEDGKRIAQELNDLLKQLKENGIFDLINESSTLQKGKV